jgi:CRP-like cAMP-binding protein
MSAKRLSAKKTDSRGAIQNRLLAAFPPDGIAEFKPLTEEIDLNLGDVLYHAHEKVKYLYFPEDAMISLLSETLSGSSIEIAVIGDEGFVGSTTLLEEPTSPHKAVVQIAGKARRVKQETAAKFFHEQLFFNRMVLRYLHAMMIQMAQSAVCNSFHSVEQRMCRWLLMHCDRSGSEVLPFTHEFLAHLLGTRRESVTQVIGKFEKLGWVKSARGSITILSRKRLETFSCECYAIVRDEYQRMFDSFVR